MKASFQGCVYEKTEIIMDGLEQGNKINDHLSNDALVEHPDD